ncbi:hypothetical protein [Streptomyces sp. NPDC058086]|uniref:hypothetical protein n=1 Tax=Streptomyces sp. NPDC058086 TaxID=3346334 RepID=UPI0036E749E7
MASVLGLLEEREVAAQVRAEGLRDEVARLIEVLEAAEIELDRRVIAWEAASSLAPVPGSTVPPWYDGLAVTVLTPGYEQLLAVCWNSSDQRVTGRFEPGRSRRSWALG